MFTRAAAVTPSTLNEGDRSVEVVFSTGARVRRADGYDDPYFEELSLDPQHVRLDRLRSGAARVLMGHKADSVEHVSGWSRVRAWRRDTASRACALSRMTPPRTPCG